MSESSDTGQTSIVFLGRDSFRMQVVGADAVPNAFWEGPTEKIMERRNWERRNFERRKERRADDVPAALATTPAAWRKIVIGISLATFACGITVAMAFNRMQSRARAERIAAIDMGTLGGSPNPRAMERAGQSPAAPHAIERVQPPAVAPAPQPAPPAPQPAAPASPAIVVAPIANPEPAASPAPAASAPPVADRPAEKPVAPPKARPATRIPAARAARPRRMAAAAPAIQAATQPPPAASRPKKVWVDPFAE